MRLPDADLRIGRLGAPSARATMSPRSLGTSCAAGGDETFPFPLRGLRRRPGRGGVGTRSRSDGRRVLRRRPAGRPRRNRSPRRRRRWLKRHARTQGGTRLWAHPRSRRPIRFRPPQPAFTREGAPAPRRDARAGISPSNRRTSRSPGTTRGACNGEATAVGADFERTNKPQLVSARKAAAAKRVTWGSPRCRIANDRVPSPTQGAWFHAPAPPRGHGSLGLHRTRRRLRRLMPYIVEGVTCADVHAKAEAPRRLSHRRRQCQIATPRLGGEGNRRRASSPLRQEHGIPWQGRHMARQKHVGHPCLRLAAPHRRQVSGEWPRHVCDQDGSRPRRSREDHTHVRRLADACREMGHRARRNDRGRAGDRRTRRASLRRGPAGRAVLAARLEGRERRAAAHGIRAPAPRYRLRSHPSQPSSLALLSNGGAIAFGANLGEAGPLVGGAAKDCPALRRREWAVGALGQYGTQRWKRFRRPSDHRLQCAETGIDRHDDSSRRGALATFDG